MRRCAVWMAVAATLATLAVWTPPAAAVHTHQEYFPTTAQGHERECFDQKVNKYGRVGETWTTTGCKLAKCIESTNFRGETQLAISEDGCEKIKKQRGCRQTAVNRNLDYPDCCPKLQCLGPDGRKTVTQVTKVKQR